MTEKKGIQSERDYEAMAKKVLEIQHERLRSVAVAYVQAYDWMKISYHHGRRNGAL